MMGPASSEGFTVAERTLVEAIRDGLREEMSRDSSVIVMGEDVGKHGGVFGVTEGLQSTFGADRAIDTPLAELGIVGIACRRNPVRRLHPPGL